MNLESAEGRRWLERAIGPRARVDDLVALDGATSSSLYRIDAFIGGRVQRFVLRLFTMTEWLEQEPDLVAHEANVLQVAEACGLPAPRLVAETARDVGFGAPAIVMSFVEGEVNLRPSRLDDWIDAQAAMLGQIHRSDASALRWRYRTWTTHAQLNVPDWSRRVALWQRAIDVFRRGAPNAASAFLHRDFHPVNVLWRGGELSAVVDWVNGCVGPAGVDVAHCRLNLALMFGADVADAFSRAYAPNGFAGFDDPYWDVDCVLGALPDPTYYAPWRHFGLGPIEPAELRSRLEDHLSRALARA